MAQAQSVFIPKASTAADLAALDYWTANDAIFPSGAKGTDIGVNNQPVVVYPKDEDEHIFLGGVMGEDYDGGIITLSFFWLSPATGGDVVWFVAWERDNAGKNLTVDTFAVAKSVVSPAPAAPGELAKATLSFTQAEADSVAPGDPFRIRVRRDAAVLLDTLDGDAQLFRVALEAL